MAVLPVITNVYRCAFRWAGVPTGKQPVNVMHFLAPASTPTAVMAALNANVTANMWAPTLLTIGVQQVDITKLDGSAATQSFATGLPTKWSGGQGVSNVVPQVANIVKFQTALRGRSHRGRIYLPAPSEASIADGLTVAGVVTVMQTAWSAFITNMSAASVTPVVASYKLSTAGNIISAVVESQCGTIRRRQPR